MKKLLVATILAVPLTGQAIVPSAKADTTFVYNVTTGGPGNALDVTFDLPSFDNPANGISTFVSGTLNGKLLISFGISGNSSNCADSLGDSAGPGPCWVGINSAGSFSFEFTSPSFSAPGTFTASASGVTTTVTITEVVGAPEPSSVALMLLGVGLVSALRKRRTSGLQQGS